MASMERMCNSVGCVIINPQGKMPVGLSNFAKLAQGGYCFVDKTLFIKEVLDAGDDVILITRPRRFGKTLNMSMLQHFLQQPANEEEDLFADLAISRLGEGYQQERGKRPVLFLSFRTVKELNWEAAFRRMSGLLSDLAQEARQGAPVDCLTPSRQDILHKVIHKQAKPDECESILRVLTELLTLKHEGMTPWVLIDEYDAPMQAAYQNDYYKPMRNLMKGLLGDCLKDNDFLHRSVITGILRVSKEDIFSDLNNLGTYGVTEDRFADSFGFTEAEVKELLSGRDMDDRLDPVRDWYNGYRFGRATIIYNPWSVINYLANPNDEARPYWVNTSSNYLIHKLLTQANPKVKQGLRELLDGSAGHTTRQVVQENIPLRELETASENLWGLLLAAGYLTTAHVVENEENDGDTKMTQLRIPNNEVQQVYGGLIRRWLRTPAGINGSAMIERLLQGDVESFAQDFAEFVHESISYFDAGGNHPEQFYHGFVLGMLHHLRGRYTVASQQESGGGRYDLALLPRDKNELGFVFEFKSLPHMECSPLLEVRKRLRQPAQKALGQIIDKAYHTQLFTQGIKQVIALGLAFGGKQVAVASATLPQSEE